MHDKINICWLNKKYKKKFVCFIPLTIDGVGVTADKALKNLEQESAKIIRALGKSRVKCMITVDMVEEAVKKATWWYSDGKSKSWKKGK